MSKINLKENAPKSEELPSALHALEKALDTLVDKRNEHGGSLALDLENIATFATQRAERINNPIDKPKGVTQITEMASIGPHRNGNGVA